MSRRVWPIASCAPLDVSVLQQSELPPDVSVLQQSLDVFFTTFRSTAVIGQTSPGTVHTAVELRHQTCLGTAQTAVKNTFRRSTACYSIEQTHILGQHRLL
jgi:hypothetical protein